ncbi:MAG: hypothetical protein NZ921_01415 [Candidatus Caldarchaeum sp.]|nr:hypothetical protein [Candidatus Caldarchaeum sp.]
MENDLMEQLMSAPWRILFDVTRLDRVKVWEVQLGEVIDEFARALRMQGYVDFNLCGIAVHSAAVIHRIKSEKLLQGDVPPKPKPKPEITVLPPIELPFKPELLTATVQEIVTALQKALSQSARRKTDAVPPQIQENRLILDQFMVKIEEELDSFLEKLRKIFANRPSITFSELVESLPRLEAAKTFILLLFAAARRHVLLLQSDDGFDLIVLVGELLGPNGGR